MKQFAVLALIILLIVTSCQKPVQNNSIGGSQERIPAQQQGCFCTALWDPVCGSDGKTYSNSCVAQCAGIKDYTKGECA